MAKKRSSMLMNYQPPDPQWAGGASTGTALGLGTSSPRNNRTSKLMNMTVTATDPIFAQIAKVA